MARTAHPTCPPLRSGKPELGETRTLPNGDLEHKNAGTGDWEPAVRLNDVRGTLIANAALHGIYTHARGVGKDAHNVTAYFHADRDFGGEWIDRPAELKQIKRKPDQYRKKPEGVKTHLGKVLLDPYDHPIRNFPELPATLSTEMKGWEVEYYLRKNLDIRPYDLMALCMSDFIDGKGNRHEGPPRIASLIERATKFRRKAGLPSFKIKPGSENITKYVKSLLPHGAETTEALGRDLTRAEIKASQSQNTGKYPARRRKSKKEKEAREAEEKQRDQPHGHVSLHSAQSQSASQLPTTGQNGYSADVGALPAGGDVVYPTGLKRAHDSINEGLQDADVDTASRPSRRQKLDTTTRSMQALPRQKHHSLKVPNTASKKHTKIVRGTMVGPMELDNPVMSFSHAQHPAEVATEDNAQRSMIIQSQGWQEDRNPHGNSVAARARDIPVSKHTSNLTRAPAASKNHGAQWLSIDGDRHENFYSTSPVTRMAVVNGYEEGLSTNRPRGSDHTEKPYSYADHMALYAYPNAGPAQGQTLYQGFCRDVDQERYSYNAQPLDTSPSSNSVINQSASHADMFTMYVQDPDEDYSPGSSSDQQPFDDNVLKIQSMAQPPLPHTATFPAPGYHGVPFLGFDSAYEQLLAASSSFGSPRSASQ